MRLSEAILLGDSLKKSNPKRWLDDDGCAGCAFGGAMLAAGIGHAYLAEIIAREKFSGIEPERSEVVMRTWPWLTREILSEITKLYDAVVAGSATIEDVAAYVRGVEPFDPDPSFSPYPAAEAVLA